MASLIDRNTKALPLRELAELVTAIHKTIMIEQEFELRGSTTQKPNQHLSLLSSHNIYKKAEEDKERNTSKRDEL